MSSPDPSHDSFASKAYDQWDPFDDPFDDPSRRQTQTNELQLCQFADWDSGSLSFLDRIRTILQVKYEPLNTHRNEIRLLTILPDNDNGAVCCTLSHASLDDSPTYAALSYCWGDPKKTRPVTVNGCIFNATINLEAGLRELRRQGFYVVWVDALCINQRDTEERGKQILRMRDI